MATVDRSVREGSVEVMSCQILHLYLTSIDGDVEVRVLAATQYAGAVYRGPRPPRLNQPPVPDGPCIAARDFHAAAGLGTPPDEWRVPGESLFHAIFQGEVYQAYAAASDAGRPLRLVLEFSPREDHRFGLQALPWECLYDPVRRQFLARAPLRTLIRFVPPHVRDTHSHPTVAKPRVLVVASQAGNCGELDLEQEIRELRQSFRKTRIDCEVLRNPSREQLFDRLRQGGFHVLHFMGHATLRSGRGALILHDEDGHAVAESADELAAEVGEAIRKGARLRLVFLNACDTAATAAVRPFGAVATSLVREGVPAVIAMQRPVADREAILFSGTVYRKLVEGEPLDQAVADGRRRLRLRRGLWWAPVLYSFLEDPRIFVRPAAKRWKPVAGAALATAALVISTAWLVIQLQPQAPSLAEFPRAVRGSGVVVTMPSPCKFIERELRCWAELDSLGPFLRTFWISGETRLLDNQGGEYSLAATHFDGTTYYFTRRTDRHAIDLLPLGAPTIELVFDGISRHEKKARALEIVTGDGERFVFEDFHLDRD